MNDQEQPIDAIPDQIATEEGMPEQVQPPEQNGQESAIISSAETSTSLEAPVTAQTVTTVEPLPIEHQETLLEEIKELPQEIIAWVKAKLAGL